MARIIDLDQVRAGAVDEGEPAPSIPGDPSCFPGDGGLDSPCALIDTACTGQDQWCGVDFACTYGPDAPCGIDNACG